MAAQRCPRAVLLMNILAAIARMSRAMRVYRGTGEELPRDSIGVGIGAISAAVDALQRFMYRRGRGFPIVLVDDLEVGVSVPIVNGDSVAGLSPGYRL